MCLSSLSIWIWCCLQLRTSMSNKMGSVGCSQASADCYLWLHTVYVPFQVERKVTCKTCILQICCLHVHLECTRTVCFT
ncbi:hypothetical protein E1A91_D02G185600v1 [Gossypium mustelinum]|uniref:Secreted protein n=2 Tax=Gossypium TaxID=3633 RepID=A0A5D2VY28_GOSMU|nr:hypothetical protein E1A91_D02G185600v1 [Gossypium mustelinum]